MDIATLHPRQQFNQTTSVLWQPWSKRCHLHPGSARRPPHVAFRSPRTGREFGEPTHCVDERNPQQCCKGRRTAVCRVFLGRESHVCRAVKPPCFTPSPEALPRNRKSKVVRFRTAPGMSKRLAICRNRREDHKGCHRGTISLGVSQPWGDRQMYSRAIHRHSWCQLVGSEP